MSEDSPSSWLRDRSLLALECVRRESLSPPDRRRWLENCARTRGRGVQDETRDRLHGGYGVRRHETTSTSLLSLLVSDYMDDAS